MNYSVIKTKEYLEKLENKTRKNIWIDEFVRLRSKV